MFRMARIQRSLLRAVGLLTLYLLCFGVLEMLVLLNRYRLSTEEPQSTAYGYRRIHIVLTPSLECRGSNAPFLLAYVNSARGRPEHRSAIREAWLLARNITKVNVRVLFVLGAGNSTSSPNSSRFFLSSLSSSSSHNYSSSITTRLNEAIDETLKKENEKYGDILQGDIVDKYENLVYKGYLAMRWISGNCDHSVEGGALKFVLKFDDDVIVNVLPLVDYLRNVSAIADRRRNVTTFPSPQLEKNIFCNLLAVDQPHRKGKYSVTMEEYSGKVYPPFCAGPAYIMSAAVVPDILHRSNQWPWLYRLEDVFYTGFTSLLSDEIHLINIGGKYTERLSSSFVTGRTRKYFFMHSFNPNREWKRVQKTLVNAYAERAKRRF